MTLHRKLGRLTPEQSAHLLYTSAKRRSSDQRNPREFTISVEDVLKQVLSGECPRTGVPFDLNGDIDSPFRPSLDRIDNSIGYTPDNIQVVSRIYNRAKWTYTDGEMYIMAKGIVKKMSKERCPDTQELDL